MILTLFFIPLFSAEDIEITLNKKDHDLFCLMTIPKSGTHLIAKLLYLITGKTYQGVQNYVGARFVPAAEMTQGEFDETFQQIFLENKAYPTVHFTSGDFVSNLRENYPFKIVIIVRDLRDVCVSAVHYFSKFGSWNERVEKTFGHIPSFDEKLNFVIRGDLNEKWDSFNIVTHAETFMKWLNAPDILIVRFEDLIGTKGNGDVVRQKETIVEICQFLGVELSPLEMRMIARQLWGPHKVNMFNTFRKGKIGEWKKVFKPEHIEMFKEHLGPYLIALGYEEDNSW